MATTSSNNNAYFLDRDYMSAARLQLQHYVCHTRMGYLLHPTIEASIKDKPAPSIIDLGTGTGIWAVEVGRAFPNAKVLGTDVADNQFPPPGTLPKNIGFQKYNFFDPVPEELAGSFDVVHLSHIGAAIYKSGPDEVIKHISQFLKPGGWVQWREIHNDPDILLDAKTLKPAGELPATNFVDTRMGFFKALDFAREMPKLLESIGGLIDAKAEVIKSDPALFNLETSLLLWNTHETLKTMGNALGTDEAEDAAKAAIEETEQKVRDGNVLHWHFMVGIAKKPE